MSSTTGTRDELIHLLRVNSFQRGDFELSSGRRSPYYVDARRTTMSARGLALIGQLGLEAIRDAGWTPELVGGLTLGADPVSFAVAAASQRRPPAIDGFAVRKAAKSHGTARRIEGPFRPGVGVVVTEDVVTTGASALEAATAVVEAGGSVLGILALVDRDEGGREALEAAGYRVIALVSLEELAAGP